MSETKLEVKTGGIAKITHFAKFAKISLCLIAKIFFFFFFLKNQIK